MAFCKSTLKSKKWLLVMVAVVFLAGCKDSKAEDVSAMVGAEGTKNWAEEFHPEILPDGMSDAIGERYHYLQKQCEEVILPQWKTAPDIDSALVQLEDLMSQIGAHFYAQGDIRRGYIAYYYRTEEPYNPENPSYIFNAYNTHFFKEHEPEGYERSMYLFKKYGFSYLPSGAHNSGFSGFRNGVGQRTKRTIALYDGNKVRLMFPMAYAEHLDEYWTSEELQKPAGYVTDLIVKEGQLRHPSWPYPEHWHFLYSERRDAFSYRYMYKLRGTGYDEKYFLDAFEIAPQFDAKRTEDGKLVDVEMRDIVCGIVPVASKFEARGLVALSPTFFEEKYVPEKPVMVCPANEKWVYCYGYDYSVRDREVDQFCRGVLPQRPSCKPNGNE